MADQIIVKASVKYVQHRLLSLSTQSVDHLKENIRRSFTLLQQPNIVFKIFWKDPEGDLICLETDADLHHAVELANDRKTRLDIDIVVDVIPTRNLSQLEAATVQADLAASHNVRGPPGDIPSHDVRGPPRDTFLQNYSSSIEETVSRNFYSSKETTAQSSPQHSFQDGNTVIAQQISSQEQTLVNPLSRVPSYPYHHLPGFSQQVTGHQQLELSTGHQHVELSTGHQQVEFSTGLQHGEFSRGHSTGHHQAEFSTGHQQLYQQSSISDSNSSQQISLEGLQDDVLDIPVDNSLPIIDGWPSEKTYSLSMISKMKRTLQSSVLSNQAYLTDIGRQCRVLCLLNKTVNNKDVYKGNGIDMETTFLHQVAKKLHWDLQIHKNKTFQEMNDILNDEMKRDFSKVHSFILIIVTAGGKDGLSGTDGGVINYSLIPARFDQVPGLQQKPKIFIFDDCQFFKDDELSRGIQGTYITVPKQTAQDLTELSRGIQGMSDEIRDQRDCEALVEKHQDTFICKATTLGRSDKTVKGSWVVGALISLLCHPEGGQRSFQDMMVQVRMMFEEAMLPGGVPSPEIFIDDNLVKPLYLLPPCT